MSLVRKCDLCKSTDEKGFFGIEVIKFVSPTDYDYHEPRYDVCGRCYDEIYRSIKKLTIEEVEE